MFLRVPTSSSLLTTKTSTPFLRLEIPSHSVSNKIRPFGEIFVAFYSYGLLPPLKKKKKKSGSILWALNRRSGSFWSSQFASLGMEFLPQQWAGVKVIKTSGLSLQCLDGASSLSVEAGGRNGTRNLASVAQSGRAWEILAACPSVWDMVSPDWEFRKERVPFSWSHHLKQNFNLPF